MSLPSPKSPELSEKSRKYDRQLRLWGEHGQVLLENAAICLVNATAVGCETLKSLVLPGIGSFTIADNNRVNEEDFGVSFFLDPTSLGKSRAAECTRLLQELNTDVVGDFVEDSVEYILDYRPKFFNAFTVVIASNLKDESLLKLSNVLWQENIPFVYCRSLGFMGSVRLQIKEHCVQEAHPDTVHYDLRLEHPFPALAKHLQDTEVNIKVPWLVVLNHYLGLWRAQHDGRMPNTYKEKMELRQMLTAAKVGEQENFEEAIKSINSAFGGGVITPNIRAIFEDDSCLHLNKQSKPFWLIVRAMRDFAQQDNGGYLPLAGILPDMTADSGPYVALQSIYHQQAEQDALNVYRRCQKYLKELEMPAEIISEAMVRRFCRDSSNIQLIRGTPLSGEYEKGQQRVLTVLEDPEIIGTLNESYVALRGYERYLTECGNPPGECCIETDTSRLKGIAVKMLADIGVHHNCLSDDMIHEVCRYGGSECHVTATSIGSCAAQEVIKIITQQYVPIDNTFLFDGISQRISVLKL